MKKMKIINRTWQPAYHPNRPNETNFVDSNGKKIFTIIHEEKSEAKRMELDRKISKLPDLEKELKELIENLRK
jgi:formylmethanofuran dehydrogenase subunit E